MLWKIHAEHKEPVVLFCKNCQFPICLRCENMHTMHKVVKIYVENMMSKSQLQESIGTLTKAKNMTEKGCKDVDQLMVVFEEHAADTVREVQNKFAYWHGLLQLAEQQTLGDLKNEMQRFNEIGNDIKLQLDRNRELFEEKIACCDHFAKNVPRCKRVKNLIEQSTSRLATLPCKVLFNSITAENPFKFITQQTGFEANFHNLCNITADKKWFDHTAITLKQLKEKQRRAQSDLSTLNLNLSLMQLAEPDDLQTGPLIKRPPVWGYQEEEEEKGGAVGSGRVAQNDGINQSN
jgi:B-box zinc finger